MYAPSMTEQMGGEWGGAVAAVGPRLHSEDMRGRPPRREASFEDLEEVPPNQVGEIVDGELYVSPRPAPRHSRATSRLVQALAPFDKPPGTAGLGGWVILIEPEMHLGRNVLVPDLAGWRRER